MARGRGRDDIAKRLTAIPREWLANEPDFPEVRLEVARQYLLEHLPLDEAEELGLTVSEGEYADAQRGFHTLGITLSTPPHFFVYAKDYPSAERVQEFLDELDGGMGMKPWGWTNKQPRNMGRAINIWAIPPDYQDAVVSRMDELYWPAKARFDAERVDR